MDKIDDNSKAIPEHAPGAYVPNRPAPTDAPGLACPRPRSRRLSQVAAAPLAPQVSKTIHQLYLAKGALATTAIEGNTLSEEEALAAVAGSLDLPPSRQYLKREIDNIVAACNELVAELEAERRIPITAERLKRMNALVLDGLDMDDHVVPGQVRTVNVSAGRYRCPEGRDAEFLVQRLCAMLENMSAPDLDQTAFAILKAIFAHVYFVWIHPFGDGNGRTARLVELAILLEAGLPQPTCHLLSNHYNLTRTSYYRELERASQQPNGIYRFLAYALRGFADGLTEKLAMIRQHQWEVAWVHFVHEQVPRPAQPDRSTTTHTRTRPFVANRPGAVRRPAQPLPRRGASLRQPLSPHLDTTSPRTPAPPRVQVFRR